MNKKTISSKIHQIHHSAKTFLEILIMLLDFNIDKIPLKSIGDLMKVKRKHLRRALRPGMTTCYHVFSHFAAEVPYLEDWEKEVFVKQLWKTAYSCALELLTFSCMGNHFHLLLRVPSEVKMGDDELLERYRVLYPKPNKFQAKGIEDYEREIRAGGSTAEAARVELLERMGDLPKFMQLLKQRFSIFYNKSRGRSGTLWAGRFKSVLVEDRVEVLKVVAAYIDLNAVRAGLVKDPKDYRFCGYGQWIGGGQEAAEGFGKLFRGEPDQWAMGQYRQILYGKGVLEKTDVSGGAVLDAEDAQKVLETGGKLSESERLLCKARYFRDGFVLGTHHFIKEAIPHLRQIGATRRKSEKTFSVAGFEESNLAGFRQLRKKAG